MRIGTRKCNAPSAIVHILFLWTIIIISTQVSVCDAAIPAFLQNIIDVINTIIASYDNKNRNEDSTNSNDVVEDNSNDSGTILSSPAPSSTPTTIQQQQQQQSISCPEINWDGSFCQANYDPYYCMGGTQCMYGNECEATLAGFTKPGDCIPKCPKVEWERCKSDTNIIMYTCNDDCFYNTVCEVKESGYDIDIDCVSE